MDITRRYFLKFVGSTTAATVLFTGVGYIPAEKELLRPPGALKEPHFLEMCLHCQQCINSCPEKALRQAHIPQGLINTGTPYLEGTCTLCLACMENCPSGAIKKIPPEQIKMGTAEIVPMECIGCAKCIPACSFQAIEHAADKKSIKILEDRCRGCMACVEACPVKPKGIKVTARGARRLSP